MELIFFSSGSVCVNLTSLGITRVPIDDTPLITFHHNTSVTHNVFQRALNWKGCYSMYICNVLFLRDAVCLR